MAGGVVAPILAEIRDQLNVDPAFAGILVSMHCLTIALFAPPLGILADKFGAVRVLVPSLVCYGISGIAGAAISSFAPLLATRALLGAASGGIAAASLGLVGRMYEGSARSRALGYATATLTVTGIIYPLLGGLAGLNNWRFAFLLYGIAFPLAMLASATLNSVETVPHHRQQPNQLNDNKQLLDVLGHSQTVRLLLILGLTSVTMYSGVIYAPLYLKETIDADTFVNGLVLASRALGAALISAFGARQLAQAVGVKKAIAIGFCLMAVTLTAIPFLQQLRWLLATAVAFGFGFGISLPNLYNSLAEITPRELRSSVLAAGTGAGFLGQFLSPVLLGPVLDLGGLEWTFYGASTIALLAGFLLFVPVEFEGDKY